MKHFLIKQFLIICFLLNTIVFYSQETDAFIGEARIYTDNDAFVSIQNFDQYYSFGIGIGYAFNSEKVFGLEKIFSEKKAYFFDIEIKMEAFSPSNEKITEEDIIGDNINFDRPFAGLFFGSFKVAYVFDRSFFKTGVLLGVIGPAAGAGETQKWVHESILGDSGLAGWDYQLSNQLLLNFSAEYTYDFNIAPSWLDLYGTAEAQLGNLYINSSSFLGLRIGKLGDLKSSSSFGNGLLADKKGMEFFIQSSIGVTLEAFNGTAQGSLFNQNYPYALDKTNPVYTTMTQGVYVTFRQFSGSFNYVFTYGKVVENAKHIYGSIYVKYRF